MSYEDIFKEQIQLLAEWNKKNIDTNIKDVRKNIGIMRLYKEEKQLNVKGSVNPIGFETLSAEE